MYRILTENKNIEKIRLTLDLYLGSYTLIPAEGVWKGNRENSLVIEADLANEVDVFKAAREIKDINNQEAVLVQRIELESVLI